MSALLEVKDLRIAFPSPAGMVHPVDGVSLDIARGELMALVGESGCGKSLTSLAILRLLPPTGQIVAGSSIRFDGHDLLALDPAAIRAIRGRRIGMVFQDPMTALNPVLTIGYQLAETITTHHAVSSADARARALALLDEVGIPQPAEHLECYAHQLSGGLRQRVLIALALAGEPDLLVADEPTTALDVTVQAQILELLEELRTRRGMAVLLVTHDLGIVAGRADRVAVMYAGQLVEEGPADRVCRTPEHPYTRGLFRSMPRIDQAVRRLETIGGQVPSPSAWPAGCRFHPRCPERLQRCGAELPPWVSLAPGHQACCWLHAPGGSAP
ncbi:MAG: ABC transporter ATP-binding protein [Gemmatimonadales bacterium]